MTIQAWIFLGFAVLSLYLGFVHLWLFPKKPLTFESHYVLEYKRIFGEGSQSRANVLLSARKSLLRRAYMDRDECNKGAYRSNVDWEVYSESEKVVRERHTEYDYARGLAYLYGHGRIADEVHEKKD